MKQTYTPDIYIIYNSCQEFQISTVIVLVIILSYSIKQHLIYDHCFIFRSPVKCSMTCVCCIWHCINATACSLFHPAMYMYVLLFNLWYHHPFTGDVRILFMWGREGSSLFQWILGCAYTLPQCISFLGLRAGRNSSHSVVLHLRQFVPKGTI